MTNKELLTALKEVQEKRADFGNECVHVDEKDTRKTFYIFWDAEVGCTLWDCPEKRCI